MNKLNYSLQGHMVKNTGKEKEQRGNGKEKGKNGKRKWHRGIGETAHGKDIEAIEQWLCHRVKGKR